MKKCLAGKSYLRNLLVQLVIVLVMALLMQLLVNAVQLVMRRQAIDKCQEALCDSMVWFDEDVNAIAGLLAQTKSMQYISRVSIIKKELYPSDYIALRNLQQYLSAISSVNPNVLDVICFFGNSGIVSTRYNTFLSPDEFRRFYQSEDAFFTAITAPVPTHQNARAFAYLPGGRLSLHQTSKEVAVCYRLPISSNATIVPHSYAYVLFDMERFRARMLASMNEYGCVYLEDEEGTVLTQCVGNAFDEATDDSFTGIRLSTANGSQTLFLHAFISEDYFRAALSGIRAMVNGWMLGILLCGVTVAVLAAFIQTLPMRRLLAELSDSGLTNVDTPNDYLWLRNSVLSAQAEKQTIFSRLEQYRSLLRSNSLTLLCSTSMLSEEQYRQAQESLLLLPRPFLVAYGRIRLHAGEDLRAGDMLTMLLTRELQEILPAGGILQALDERTLLLLIPCEDGDEQGTVAKLRTKLEMLNNRIPHQVLLAFGTICKDVKEINASFECARIRYTANREEAEGGEKTERGDGYSIRSISQLYQAVLHGEKPQITESVRASLSAAYAPGESMRQRFLMLRSLMLLAARDSGAELDGVALPECKASDEPEGLCAKLEQCADELMPRIIACQHRLQDQRIQKMLAYIQAHFREALCCPASIAEHFSLSEKYVYALFREAKASTPAAYILDLRLEAAAQSLRETDATVQEVGERAGFTTFNTFYKAFKRTYGITPTQYRAQQEIQK